MYELFEHTADLGVRVRAADLDELFADAARGLLSTLVANPEDVRPAQEHRVSVEGTELDYLLMDWLTELLFRFDAERLLFAAFAPRVRQHGLTAVARGEPLDTARHQLEHEVKAITYHGLKVVRTAAGWLAEVIVDI